MEQVPVRPQLARSVFFRLTMMLLVSNAIAAALDFLYLTFVLPPYNRRRTGPPTTPG